MDWLHMRSTFALGASSLIGSAVIATAAYFFFKRHQLRRKLTIFDCARIGDQDAIFARLSKQPTVRLGTSIDGLLDEEGYSLAMRAIEGNQFDTLVTLVERLNATVSSNMKNKYAFTCLHLSVYHEVSSRLFDYVLKACGSAVDPRESDGWTPLMIAASKGNVEFCEKLISCGAQVDAVSHMDQTALYVASNNGFLNIVQMLIDAGADAKIRVKKSFDSPAIAAITAGRYEVLEYLVTKEPELLKLPTVSGATLLHAAAQIGKIATVEMLVKHGAEIDAKKKDGTTPLTCAAVLGHSSIVKVLLENGASLDSRNCFGGTALHLACNKKELEMVETLLKYGADPNLFDTDRISPLQSLCSSSHDSKSNNSVEIQIFDLLVKHGADVNHKDRSNATFLHQLVCKRENVNLLKHVLTSMPDFNLFHEDRYGYVALHLAYRYKHTEMIEILSSAMKRVDEAKFALFDADKERIEPPVGECDIFETVPLTERQGALDMDLTLSGFAKKILSGHVKNVIVLTGAGISTNSGIPDFRSPEKGLYTSPQFRARFGPGGVTELFSPNAVIQRPEAFFSVCKEVFGPAVDGRYKPTPAHFFIKMLHDKGLLRRNYTQNIDMLERLVGIPREKVIEAHGSFAKATCVQCFTPCTDMAEYWNEIRSDSVPRCSQCRGVLRPNVVFFGEGLPAEFTDHQATDFEACDLLIVMGTSLKVYPFAGLVNQVKNVSPRLLFNLEAVGAFVHGAQWQLPNNTGNSSSSKTTLSSQDTEAKTAKATSNSNSSMERLHDKKEYTNSYRDVAVIGDIDQGVLELVKMLGWDEELKEMIRTYKPFNHFDN